LVVKGGLYSLTNFFKEVQCFRTWLFPYFRQGST